MPRRKNGSSKLKRVTVLEEDKKRIDKRTKKTGEAQYEVISEALDALERFESGNY